MPREEGHKQDQWRHLLDVLSVVPRVEGFSGLGDVSSRLPSAIEYQGQFYVRLKMWQSAEIVQFHACVGDANPLVLSGLFQKLCLRPAFL